MVHAGLEQRFAAVLKKDEPLSNWTTFRIGGPAAYLIVATTSSILTDAVTYCRQESIPFVVIGGGSNLLCSDDGFDGVVIVAHSAEISFSENIVRVDAGIKWTDLLDAVAVRGLGGLEWGADIPGTVGGAVRGNAGAYGGEIKDRVQIVTVLRDGATVEVSAGACAFRYRDSAFKHNGDIILSVTLELVPERPEVLRARMDETIATRRAKLPSEPSAGSDFKNIVVTENNREQLVTAGATEEHLQRGKVPAGYLIQRLDLLGTKIGGAQISPKHGNCIINTGTATASDVLQLLSLVKMKVRDSYGIQLEEEIQLIGF